MVRDAPCPERSADRIWSSACIRSCITQQQIGIRSGRPVMRLLTTMPCILAASPTRPRRQAQEQLKGDTVALPAKPASCDPVLPVLCQPPHRVRANLPPLIRVVRQSHVVHRSTPHAANRVDSRTARDASTGCLSSRSPHTVRRRPGLVVLLLLRWRFYRICAVSSFSPQMLSTASLARQPD
jgi:hypothetical protein